MLVEVSLDDLIQYDNDNILFSKTIQIDTDVAYKEVIYIVYKCNRWDSCQRNRKFIIAGHHKE